MKITVCIPAYRANTVSATIQSILQQTWDNWELLAVGQGPFLSGRAKHVKSSIEKTGKVDSRVKYLHIDKFGATSALNTAIDRASGDLIAIIDDDCEAREDWLATMVAYFDKHPDIGGIGGAAVAPPKENRFFAVCPEYIPEEGVYDPNVMDTPPPGIDWISCNIVLRPDVIESVGPFDRHLGPGATFPAGDDTDYKLRLEAHRIKIATTPNLVVHHTHGYRYGIKAIWGHAWNYNYGNGALAAKLTLSGDPRGEIWLNNMRKLRLFNLKKMYRLPWDFIHYWIYRSGYQQCMREFHVENGLLKRRTQG